MTKTRALLALTSLPALAAGLALPALAQVATSYNAPDPTVVSGTVGISRGITAGQETYTIETPTAVLDFTPNDQGVGGGAIDFQNAGTSVTYVNGTGTSDFTILNRIVPTDTSRAVQFNGTVRARLQQGAAAGGNVWFYSPGGIVLGATAAFDIGGLLLTARDPTGGTGTIGSSSSFAGGGVAGSSIRIDPGATINATPAGSYVALMAPAVSQGGTVRVNGSVGYVAAEAATLTINSGLFDIVVGTGTDTVVDAGSPGVVLDHAGSTSGPADAGNVYMVAVPKNDAITMLVQPGGQMGFDLAGAAQVVNGNVVLSAGRGITGGQIDTTPPIGTGDASIVITGGDFTSDVTARARTDVTAASTTATPDFAGDVTLQAGRNAWLAARQAGQAMTIGGDVTLISDGLFTGTPAPTFTGGEASLYTEGGTMTVGGNVVLRADVTAGTSGSATGGQAMVAAIGGSIDIGGSVDLSAGAIGGASAPLSPAATLTGGLAGVEARNGGTLTVAGRVEASADATGTLTQTGTAGAATGGQAFVRTGTGGGTVTLQGNVTLSAVAQGHDGAAAGTVAGNATGGAVYVRASSGSIAIDGAVALDGGGTAGDSTATGAAGGDGQGGNVFVQADAGTGITLGSSVALLSDGRGGTNAGGGDGFGGTGTGGPAAIIGIGDIAVADGITIGATGIGGNKTAGNGGGGGTGRGGRGRILGAGGDFTIDGDIVIDAIGLGGFVSGGATGNGGAGRGGGARLGTTVAGSTLTATGDVDLRADGSGNSGAGAGSLGGDGFGGDLVQGANNFLEGAYLVADAGVLNVGGDVQISATGLAGDGATGGFGQGGIAYVLGNDGQLAVEGGLIANVDGFGGDGLNDGVSVGGGAGGTGSGGYFKLGTFAQNGVNGAVTLTTVVATSAGLGGSGADGLDSAGGRGGDGFGGTVLATAEASARAVSATTLVMTAEGDGGDGGDGAAGGAGTAGFTGGAGGNGEGGIVQIGTISGADLTPNTGSADFGTATLFANGVGGVGGDGGLGGSGAAGGTGGAGGSGTGGFVATLSRGTPLSVASVMGLVIGIGGDGGPAGEGGAGGGAGADGNGGAGTGGGAALSVTNRAGRSERGSATIGSVQYSTFALGGFGAVAGGSTAGEGELSVRSADLTLTDFGFANNLGLAPASGLGFSLEVADGTLEATTLNVTAAGDIALNIRDGGLLRGDTFSLFGTGSLLAVAPGGTAGTPGRIELDSDFNAAFDMNVGTGTLLQIGADLDVGGDVTISGDQVTLAGVTADGGINVNGQDVRAGDLSAQGPLTMLASGDIATGDLSSSDQMVILVSDTGSARTGDITSGRQVDIQTAGAIETGDIAAVTAGFIAEDESFVLLESANGAITTGNVSALDIRVRQGDGGTAAGIAMGDLSGERATIVGAGVITLGDVTLSDQVAAYNPADSLQTAVNAGTDLTVGDVSVQDLLILSARNGDITAGQLTTPTSAMILASDNAVIAGATTGTTVADTLYISFVGFSNYDDSFRDNGQPFDKALLPQMTLGAGDRSSIRIGTVTTGAFRAGAGAMTFGDVNAASDVRLFATGDVTLDGAFGGTDINLSAGDIIIGPGGRLGTAATGQIRLTGAVTDQPMLIGGDGGTGGFSLSGAELQRLTANRIIFEAYEPQPSGLAANMILRTISLTGSNGGAGANLVGNDASVAFESTGGIRVEGAVAIGGMADADTLSIRSGRRIEVATEQGGSIVLTGADAGALGGVLDMDAPVIAAGSNALLEQLAADIDFAGRDALLATPAAQPREDGFLQARTMDLSVARLLAIQNSGSAMVAAGFTAGAGGMTIRAVTEPTAPAAQVVIWGRRQQADGSFLTNFATRDGIVFDTAAGQFGTALVNGCAIGVVCGGPVRPDQPGEDAPGEVATTVLAIEQLLSTDVSEALAMPEIRFVRLVDQEGLVTEQIITDPVSGAGNSSLWQGEQDDQGSVP